MPEPPSPFRTWNGVDPHQQFDGVWLHAIAGDLFVGGETLEPGDGAAIENADAIEIASRTGAEFLLFDLK